MNKNNYQQRLDKSQLSGKYYKIIYLEHPEIYLREVFLDRTPEELASRVSGLKKTFIISDSEMNPLGEFRVPEGQYFTSNFFVSKDGIYLANYEDYLTTEDSLTFDLYEPQTIY